MSVKRQSMGLVAQTAGVHRSLFVTTDQSAAVALSSSVQLGSRLDPSLRLIMHSHIMRGAAVFMAQELGDDRVQAIMAVVARDLEVLRLALTRNEPLFSGK